MNWLYLDKKVLFVKKYMNSANLNAIDIINNKARYNPIDAKY